MISLINKFYVEKFEAEVYVYNVNNMKVVFVDKECEEPTEFTEFTFSATIYNKHSDNKGLPHMVEHCIFGGSKKYNINEPFEYLVQEKRYTYLNAITFRDRVVCPFSSYKVEDFNEILDVYVDAIFNPNLSKETFEQECVRLENGSYNGIILNEMKNMYSNEYRFKNRLLSLFNEKSLKFNSAGKPKEILSVMYSDVINYYDLAYNLDNVVFSFYGINKHSEYLRYIEKSLETSKILNNSKFRKLNKDNKIENIKENQYFEVKSLKSGNKQKFVIAYELKTDFESQMYSAIFNYVFNQKSNTLLELLGEGYCYDLKYTLDKDNAINLVFIDFYFKDNSNALITNDDFCMAIMGIINNMNIDDFFVEIKNQDFKYKNKDYGYKTEGIYTLIELSKNNILNQDKYYIYLENIRKNYYSFENIQRVLLNLNKLFYRSVHNKQKVKGILNVSGKKNENNHFYYSTNYDIIDTIIMIKLDGDCKNSNQFYSLLEINENVFCNYEFIKHVHIQNTVNKSNNFDFSICLTLYTNDVAEKLSLITKLLETIKLSDLFFVEPKLNFNRLNNIEDYIKMILHYEKLKDLENCVDKYVSFPYGNIIFECYKASETKNGFKKIWTYEHNIIQNREIYIESKNIKADLNKICNNKVMILEKTEVIEDGMYKNLLILQLNKTVDFIYLELILEYLCNEVFYKKIRLENGAYEVNYNIIKLENKVVFYSDIDKYSTQTFDVFENGLQNLNVKCVSELEKYKNKVSNNFYRNERDKYLKIIKNYTNELLNIYGVPNVLEKDKVNQIVEILKSATIFSKCSFLKNTFSEEVLRDYKEGGIYVNR